MAAQNNEKKDQAKGRARQGGMILTPEKSATRPPSLNGINKQLP